MKRRSFLASLVAAAALEPERLLYRCVACKGETPKMELRHIEGSRYSVHFAFPTVFDIVNYRDVCAACGGSAERQFG